MGSRKKYKKIKDYVISRDGFVCCYCGKNLNSNTITMDHINPESNDGEYSKTNLTVSCSDCNNKRGNQSFFEFCKNFNFTKSKIEKYEYLYVCNIKIKILNIAKEEIIIEEFAIPSIIIKQACDVLGFKYIDYTIYKIDLNFEKSYSKNVIKYYFEQLIKIIERDSFNYFKK